MAVLETLALGRLFGGSKNRSQSSENPDSIYAGLIREDLDRYNTELKPLEEFYANQLMGPQAEQNRSNLLQTVAGQTDNSFNRAESRIATRNRLAGLGGVNQNDKNRLERHKGLSQAKNATDAGRFFDTLRRDLL